MAKVFGCSDEMGRGLAIGAAAGVGAYIVVQKVAAAISAADVDFSTTSNAHSGNVYETDRAVAEYLQFHYGKDADLLPYSNGPTEALNFASRTADMCSEWVVKLGVPRGAAFDVGCAVGRTSFDLSKTFDAVLGLDFSHKFIATADKLRAGASIEYTATLEGEATGAFSCSAPLDANPGRIKFIQGDACNLPPGIGPFSVIHGANLLCRLPDPEKFLESLPGLLVDGGLVVLISPYSWLKSYTPKEKWLGGCAGPDGTVKDSFKGLKAVMDRVGLKLVHEENTPFLIREHIRKYQWGISHATVWQLQK
eukprot:m.79810 g.79810  ORF g.79810 m.79810 type:complete len:308 (-) comp10844_c0_seq3:1536-2459(-)